MSRASRPGQSRPTAVIVIASDERSAEILIEGYRQVVTGQAPRETRRAALDVATGYAARIGQPVLVDARDANGYWHLVATPDGVVQAADRAVPERAQAPAPPNTLREESSGGRRRALVIVGAVAAALVLLAGTGVVVWRFLPGSEAAPGAEATADVTTLNHPAPPHFAPTVDFSRELAPDSQPGVSREGDMLAYVDPQERLNLLDADGERQWSAEMPVASGEVLGAPRFVEYGGEDAIVMETAGTLWFWPASGGAPSSVDIPEDTSAQYVGSSVLVRNDQEAFVPAGGELLPVEVPEGFAPMLAEGEDVLTAVLNGAWTWVSPDGDPVEVSARRPEQAGEMESVVTALREYVIVRWAPLQGEDTILAFHDSRDGGVVGSVEVDPADLEDVRHRSGPIGTGLVAYGPAVLDLESGGSAVVPGFEPDITVGSLVFGQLDGALVAVGADGAVEEAEEGSVQPNGLLGERAVVVHEDHLYAIPSE
ncbi:hypothetical protein A6A08_07905 [Nocardiopsis sp. TSRI0078]|uniref:hypothetical protein n=1 Tax=unclassified Nocardiopsis TaxID=2649073 RepID=UPI0009394614|nr:hypothetical protein [Nocardiopsis sp. TSRI0078]OKI17168.1 hypothetical protein A6A08_07905 [Nocardiopsis sp. TSRI0078]